MPKSIPTEKGQPRARLVFLRIEEGKTGLYYATSPNVPGLLVAEPTLESLKTAIPSAIAALFAAQGLIVIVSEVEPYEADDHLARPWIAMPAEIARAALQGGGDE
jgi:hypothetical protein